MFCQYGLQPVERNVKGILRVSGLNPIMETKSWKKSIALNTNYLHWYIVGYWLVSYWMTKGKHNIRILFTCDCLLKQTFSHGYHAKTNELLWMISLLIKYKTCLSNLITHLMFTRCPFRHHIYVSATYNSN